MTRELNKKLKKYYRNAKKLLICSRHEKKEIIFNLKNSISCFLDEHPDSDIDDIYASFGTEKDIADAYYSYENPEKIKAKVSRGKIILISIIGTLLIALIAYIIAVFSIVIIAKKHANDGFYAIITRM